MRNWLYYKLKHFRLRLRIVLARLRRLQVKALKGDDFYKVPIIINNRNRCTFLKALVSWLEAKGYRNIYILDNASDYPPLLEYYKTCPHKVFCLGRNAGYKALWESDVFAQFCRSWYVYTDPDVLPSEECPGDVVKALYHTLEKYSEFEKAGVALKIDDLPNQYANKQAVIQMENAYWEKELEPHVYDAPVDTTFALYRPFAQGIAEECPACRLGGNYTFRHMPWYENSAAPTAEESYYRAHAASNSAYWTSK